MATVTACWTFADGDQCDISVEIENDYPDAMAEAVSTCVDLMRKVMISGLCVQDDDGETDD